jgi:UDP-N-acetylmuramoyl-tripeptide--D-alanyl-D-alanine ligase
MGGAALIDDTYNANPASLHAAVEVLAAEPGTRLLVLGDMAELGAEGGALHAAAGREAREAGVDALLAVGPLSRQSADAFGSGAMHFDDVDALVAALKPLLGGDVTVLVKGSRSMRMERVVEALVAGGRD